MTATRPDPTEFAQALDTQIAGRTFPARTSIVRAYTRGGWTWAQREANLCAESALRLGWEEMAATALGIAVWALEGRIRASLTDPQVAIPCPACEGTRMVWDGPDDTDGYLIDCPACEASGEILDAHPSLPGFYPREEAGR